ncbi:MAG: DUF192 domain-containing protein [Vicinamibacterales bacterium]
MAESFLRPLVASAEASTRQLVNVRTGFRIATRVETAFDSASRRQGLLGRQSMAAGDALVIAPCPAIHTAFMQFAIDVIFAARDGRIVGLRRRVRPWRIAFAVRAFAAIELPAGTIDPTTLRVGDVLTVTTT